MVLGVRAVGYARVSTAEQADSGAGMDAQRHAIRGEAQRRGWSLEDVVEDAGYSAKDLRRPGIGVVLERMASGEATCSWSPSSTASRGP